MIASADSGYPLSGLRVIELADEQAEYCGLLLAGLGADVVKVEPPDGAPTRRIGPFFEDVADVDRSLYFWHYNRSKRSVAIDLDDAGGRAAVVALVDGADIVLDSTPRGLLDRLGIAAQLTTEARPRLIHARMSAFGDVGPWADYKGSDLVHLALGGPVMNCGYTPQPDGTYDLPPIAPQMWHAYHIAGEQLLLGILAALVHRLHTGRGQRVECSVHEAVAKSTELDLMNWVMRRAPLQRQTCAHAAETVSLGSPLVHTKDGRWLTISLMGERDRCSLLSFLQRNGVDVGDEVFSIEGGSTPAPVVTRSIPGSEARTAEPMMRAQDLVQRLFRRFTHETAPWREAQLSGVLCAPLRRPEENLVDAHWWARGTFAEVDHPDLGRRFPYATSKWVSSAGAWRTGTRAPLVGEHTEAVLEQMTAEPQPVERNQPQTPDEPARRRRSALDSVRILDFTWFLASAGATRFMAAYGAECIKVEWRDHPDTRLGAMAPVGGRAAREQATAPLEGVADADMGGQFNNKNAGKRGISLNLGDPKGLEIARRLVAVSDIVAEGFSPGVMERWGLGYDALRSIKPDIIYAQQSGMGGRGRYGRFRAVGPIAAALAGTSEMSGFAEPALPAGWGYSYLDWIGAYSFAAAMLTALYHRDRTGEGQHIDASQTEAGIFLSGTALLDWSANGRRWHRVGNRSPWKPAAPHGIYPCAGDDRWIAIACFDDDEWRSLVEVAQHPEWATDGRFSGLAERLHHQDDLDALMASWTCREEPFDLMDRLQRAGVAAGVCQTAADRVDRDPQLAELQWLAEVTGTKIGTWPIADVPVTMSETQPHIGAPTGRGAPCYGEDNDYVFGELLGMSADEIAELRAADVI